MHLLVVTFQNFQVVSAVHFVRAQYQALYCIIPNFTPKYQSFSVGSKTSSVFFSNLVPLLRETRTFPSLVNFIIVWSVKTAFLKSRMVLSTFSDGTGINFLHWIFDRKFFRTNSAERPYFIKTRLIVALKTN